MIPILFETTETAFTSNGIGRLTEAISCEVEEERNGVYELTLEYPMTGRLYGEISEGRFIYSRHSDALDAQPFRIYKITKPMNGIITVHAHHRSYDLNHVIVRPFTAGSAAEAMQRISLNTLNACPFTFWTDKSVTADFSLKVPASIRGILGGTEGSILDVYGKGEYEWDNATVKLHLNRGTDTGVTIMYGKNLTDINEESTAENLVSAVAPFWKDAEGENVVVLPEGILTLAGASSENALPLDLSDKFDEAPTVEDLRSKANTWLTNNGKLEPESNIRLSFAQLWQTEEYKSYALLQRVNLCDTVTVIYPALGVKAKTKVIRVVYDALLERYTKMELGEPKSTLSGTLARQEETVRQIVRSFQYPTISQVNAAVNTATKLITGGMGGHVVIGTNANGQPNEILIMDTDDIDTAVNVIRMNANGIGFSTTGYNGPFNNAWTIDGAFVADFITSGTLDANLIRAGIIMDKAGKNYWNLETGEISIDASAIGEDYVTSSQLEVTKNGIMASVSQTYVTKGNAVSSVATQYYSSTSPDSQQGGSWQDTVPDWQDGRYIFEKTVTTTADGQSEEKIVCISGATGATGERGPGIYKVTTEPSSYETETGGFTPAYRIALATVKIQSGVSDVFVGDVIEYDVYHYPVGYVDASYVYLGARTSIKGADGLPATAYTLIVSHAAIAKSASGTFAPASITLTAKSQTGTNAYANYSGRFKIEVYNGSSWSTKYTSSSNENTKSYTIPSGTTQVRCSLYLAGGTTTLLDQQTIPVVSDGAAGGDAYTIILDNESHTFAGGTSAAIAGTATVNVYAYKGTTAIAPTVTKANITGLPTGMTAKTVTNDSTNKKSTIVFQVTTSMVTRNGLVTIPVVADGKTFSKTFSYSLALQGIKGDTGDKGDKGDTGEKGDKGDTGEKGEKGDKGDRGATWYAGTGITGTSTTAKVFSGSGVASAIVGDHYLNTSTQNVYRCTVAGAASTAKWVYEQNIKGEQGIQGVKGDTGDTCYFHIKYSNDGGATFTGNSGEDTGSYIGTYADTVEADSVDVGDYDWVKIEGTDGRNGADHNLLMDVYASSLTKVDGPANRYLSDSSNSTTTGQFIAEANLPDPNATHFYRISATQAGKNRGLCWYDTTNPPILNGSTYRIGCYARASSGAPDMRMRFAGGTNHGKTFVVDNTNWQWFEFTAEFIDSGSTDDTYKRTYFYCHPQAAGDALDMCGFRLERVADDVLAIKLTADTAKADAATAQSTADGAAALAQAAKDSADGKITTFYQNTTPTALATGDLWINTTNNQNALSRWNGTTWVPVDNKDLATALQNAATAQATADGKIMTFAQNDAPTGTLDTGDLWVDTDDNNRLYRWNGTTWDEVTDKTNLVPNLTPWFDRPLTDVYNSTTNPNGYWNSTTLTSALTQLPDGWAHVDVTNSGTSNALLMRAVGRAVNGIVTGGNYTCLVEFRNVVNAAGIYSFYTQQANGAQFWGDGSYDGWTISAAQIIEGAKIYKPMKCVTGPTKSDTLNWLMSIASYIKPSQTVSYDFRVSLYEGDYSGPYKPYVDQTLRADVDAAQTAADNAQATANQKKQTFISTPTPPYYEGDAYFKTESGESGSAQWYVCTNTRLTAYGTGESWEDDFEPTSYALESSLQSTKTELLEEDRRIRASVEEQKTYTDGIFAPLETRTSTLEQTADNLTIDFNREISGLKERTENNENDLSSYQKVFAFTENGLQISEQRDKIQTPSVLQIDNGRISFIVDGQESSYWSGENSMFYVGDIVVGLNKKAQFGNFAWIPRSNGNLSFRWVGSAEDNN